MINVLPEHIANKIAAGEVVQRPDSIVKELLENSIDSGATSISIVVKDGGKLVIQVTDDGSGMSPEDAGRAFLRHATSKIVRYEDLENIATLGFRGEALASIAAVSQVELKTRQAADDTGTLIRIEGGAVREESLAAMSPGTTTIVKNLFFNTPARRQFLKSTATEFKHIYETVQRLALSRPEIAINFWSNDENLLNLKRATLAQRIKDLYGDRFFETLIPLQESNDHISISGFVGKPDFARRSKADQYLFLNKRFILNKSINHAIFSGYDQLLEKGNFPFYLINLDIDQRRVDVNVHPSKMEVKFSDEHGIYRFVLIAVRKLFSFNNLTPSLEVYSGSDSGSPDASLRHVNVPNYFQGQVSPADRSFQFSHSLRDSSFNLPDVMSDVPASPPAVSDIAFLDEAPLWQLHRKYILIPISSGIMIVDQHVAHERILYEKGTEIMEKGNPDCQQLLFPHTIQLPPADIALASELMPHLQALGFQVKLFGKNSIVLDGVPTDVKAGQEETILQDVLDEYKNNQMRVRLEARDNIAKSYACKAAVKAGDVLNEPEMRSLMRQLFGTKLPYVCPHGRPVMVRIPLIELDRRFMRT
ncbi:MAG: DNA mismatch repair endonuclease MutL [Ignavibacteriales bacterium]|nr:DNA mismatch repair endonuclease MutL [Ignavibacteriales bacterium]